MSCNSPICQTTTHPNLTTRPWRRVGFSSFWHALKRWYDRWQQRRDLAELDDRRLDDIGLRREDVERQVNKPFWMD